MKANPVVGSRRSWPSQRPDGGTEKTLLPPDASQVPLTWAGGGVCSKASKFQKRVDGSMEIPRMEAIGCYKTDL
jgi:hypothetical protein